MWRLGVLLAFLSLAEGARILAVVPTASYSHQIVFQPIIKELARRGHEVVYMTTDPVKDNNLPTLRNIDWSHSYEIWKKEFSDIINNSGNPLAMMFRVFDLIQDITVFQFEHPDVQTLIKNETEHFDLLMVEYSVPSMMAFRERFNCPLIAMTSYEAASYAHGAVGNTVHTLVYPDMGSAFEGELSFFQRFMSITMFKLITWYYDAYIAPNENARVEKYFGKGYSDVKSIRFDVDMLFTNTNPVLNINRPVTPATIRIGGGIHIQPEKPLPKDLKLFLDNAKEGVIYFSLGSNVKSKDLPEQTMETFMKVLGELPYKVLWKFEADDLPGKPDNVRIMKWIPQQDVLRHPNIKVFISQGGLQSLEEAMFINQTPLVGIPFFGDQEANAKKIASLGIGVYLDRHTMTEEEFKSSLLEVINNPKYKLKIKEVAQLARDEPMNALEKAVWWTEYVLRHKGAGNLKGPGLNMPAYQYYYLDIIAFVTLVLGLLSALVYFVCKHTILLTCKFICKKKVKVQ